MAEANLAFLPSLLLGDFRKGHWACVAHSLLSPPCLGELCRLQRAWVSLIPYSNGQRTCLSRSSVLNSLFSFNWHPGPLTAKVPLSFSYVPGSHFTLFLSIQAPHSLGVPPLHLNLTHILPVATCVLSKHGTNDPRVYLSVQNTALCDRRESCLT